jgi:hypothetical protein
MESNLEPLSLAHSMGLTTPDQQAVDLIAFASERMMAHKAEHGGMLVQVGPDHFETHHRFTPGLYSRTCKVIGPALMASRVHKTEHQFVIALGECYVWTAQNGVEVQVTGHVGTTTPGTFRLIYVPVECQCTTFHVTDLTDPKVIMEQITDTPYFLT